MVPNYVYLVRLGEDEMMDLPVACRGGEEHVSG